METYSILRAFADSWFLILMTAFFLGIVIYTLRPGKSAREHYRDIAEIPLRHDDAPASEKEASHG
ncbi:MAG: cbb3-type cytochrome c oxidase subunit 3 [Pseudomonadota bacterium]